MINDYINIYKKSKRIRNIELAIAKEYSKQEMRCPVHLSVGQEIMPALISHFLNNTDQVISTHRAHAHYLAKGGDLNAMIAEYLGKESGCSKGRGGSMHLVDHKVNFVGSSSIVANNIPIGVGIALANKLQCNNKISVIYFGDAAVEQGVFYESLNFAIIKKLPVLFVCENNQFSVYSHISSRQPKDREIYKLAQSIGIENSIVTNQNDFMENYCKIEKIISTIREQKVPSFIEIPCYRWLEHCGPNDDNHLNYRSKKSTQERLSNDMLNNLENHLISIKAINLSAIKDIEQQHQKEIADSFILAKNADYPKFDLSELLPFKPAITQAQEDL